MHRVLMPGGKLLRSEQFKAWFGGKTFVMDERNEKTTRDAFEAFTQSQALNAPRADSTCFKPQLPFGAIVRDGLRTLVNTYSPALVTRVKGDSSPFHTHLKKLIPDELERNITWYTMCSMVQHQGHKAQWCMVMQGVEGNGKSLLARFLAYAIGKDYTYWARPDKLAKDFNAYLVGKVLICGEEVMVGDRQDMLDVLKPLITSTDGVEIERKGVDQMNADICCNFWFTTNHQDAIPKTRNDRRFFCLQTAQQDVTDLERDGITSEYMYSLHKWAREEGFAIVAEELFTTVIPPEFDFTKGLQRAPETRSTKLAIEASRSPIERAVLDAIEAEETGFKDGWISSGYLNKLLERQRPYPGKGLKRPAALLASLDYIPHPALAGNDGQVNNPVLPDGNKPRLFVKRGSPAAALKGAKEVALAYAAAQGVGVKGAGAPLQAYVAATP
jgi:hypothetical protein